MAAKVLDWRKKIKAQIKIQILELEAAIIDTITKDNTAMNVCEPDDIKSKGYERVIISINFGNLRNVW